MATLTAYRSINMSNTEVWYGAVDSYSNSSIKIVAGSRSATYLGDFSFDQSGNVFGTLTGYEARNQGSLSYKATGIYADAYTVFDYVQSNNAPGALSYVFRGSDRINGSSGGDGLAGYAGNDVIDGNGGADRLSGMNGNDRLYGDAGSDRFTGGLGRDLMHAGDDLGRDTFVFTGRADTGRGSDLRDRIFDFDAGEDRIDVRGIDANVRAGGNQAFDWSGQTPTRNGLWLFDNGDHLIVKGDVDGDARADFEIQVMDINRMTAGDFLL